MNVTHLNRPYSRPLRARHSVAVSAGRDTDRSTVTSDTTRIDFSDAVIIRGKEVGKGKRIASKVLVGLGGYVGMMGGMVAGFSPVGAFASASALGFSALKNDSKLTVNGRTLNLSRPFSVKATDSKVGSTSKKILNQVVRFTGAGLAAAVGFSTAPVVGLVAGASVGSALSAHGVARFMPN